MIGVPMPHPRDAIIAEFNQQMDQFFATGRTVEHIARGVGAEVSTTGTTTQQNKLRAGRDRLAPRVKELIEAGKTAAETSKALGIRVKRLHLICQENGYKFAEAS